MEDPKQELLKLMDSFSDSQMRYLLAFAVMFSKLAEYQIRFVLAFVQKRFRL